MHYNAIDILDFWALVKIPKTYIPTYVNFIFYKRILSVDHSRKWNGNDTTISTEQMMLLYHNRSTCNINIAY